jgi:hypothetical protein
MPDRTDYVIACDEANRASIDAACQLAFELILPLASTAMLDGYIGWPDPPQAVLAVYRRLVAMHGEKHLMALPFDLNDAEQRSDSLTFAPWSIQAEIADDDGTVLASIHDASGVEARLTPEEAFLLRQRLAESGHPEIEVVEGATGPPAVASTSEKHELQLSAVSSTGCVPETPKCGSVLSQRAVRRL